MRSLTTTALLALALISPAQVRAQAPSANPEDVNTIERIVRAYYDVLNGPAGAPRQWRRDSTLYMPNTMFVAMSMKDGKPFATMMTPETFRRAVNDKLVKDGFYEIEIGSRIERFGNVASVRSAYETRRTLGGPLIGRGVNYLQLYWDGTRWWISAATWDDERSDTKLPAKWVGAREKSNSP